VVRIIQRCWVNKAKCTDFAQSPYDPSTLHSSACTCTIKLIFPGENCLPYDLVALEWERDLEQGAAGDRPAGLQHELRSCRLIV